LLEDAGYKDFLDWSRQAKHDFLLMTKYHNETFTWNDYYEESDVYGSFTMRTDFGICSFLHPLFLTPGLKNLSTMEFFHHRNITGLIVILSHNSLELY